MARKYGVEQLMPTSRKSSLFKETRLAERGLAIKGTGIGQKVKGHKWERTMETRLEERKKAMMEMPELIRQWKQVRRSLYYDVCDHANHVSYFLNREVMGEDGRSGLDDDRMATLQHYLWSVVFKFLGYKDRLIRAFSHLHRFNVFVGCYQLEKGGFLIVLYFLALYYILYNLKFKSDYFNSCSS